MTQDFAKLFQSMIEQGQTMARAFTPSAFGTIDPKAFEAMFPAMPKDMLEMFFGKTFNPEGLDARTRFLVAIAAPRMVGEAISPKGWLGLFLGLAGAVTVILSRGNFGGDDMTPAHALGRPVFYRGTSAPKHLNWSFSALKNR